MKRFGMNLFRCGTVLGTFMMGCLSGLSAEAPVTKIPPGYRVETVRIPDGITLGVGGLAFDSKGRLFISTREGQVWRLVGEEWTLFADGLHEALGIYIDQKTDEIWIMQRPEMTKLVDADGDGFAEEYHTVNGAWGLADNYHEYAFGLVRDKEGNFYGSLNTSLSWPGWAGSDRWDIGRVHDSKMGRAVPYRGWIFQITSAGQFVPWATGVRSPAGIGMNREGELFYTDNQGDWNATSSLHHVVRGGFHGHPSGLMDHPDFKGKDLNAISVEEYASMRRRPAVWFPHGELASSPGQPEFIYTDGKFGPFEGECIVGDQTRSNLMRVFLDKVDGEYQGGVCDFVDPLQSGCIRNVFDSNGVLWVGQTGRGWGSVGDKQFGLQKIIWDGKTVPFEIHSVSATPVGFKMRFTRPVDETALIPENFVVKHWGYLYQAEYGSPKVEVTPVNVKIGEVSCDRTVVELVLPLKAERVYQISVPALTSAGMGQATHPVCYYTMNRVPGVAAN